MSLEEKVAQLIHVAGYSNRDDSHEEYLLTLIEKYGIGGIIFFQGTPSAQAAITNRCQAASQIPLMISIDGEWGLGMRLDESMGFPYQLALGALQDNTLIYKMGKEVARQCKRIGIHVNFAPDADINNNPKNPVIGFRSFGEDKYKVAEKSIAYMKGLQDGGVMACGKHFPGHGDTSTDSHMALPVLGHDLERLEEMEFYPFKRLIEEGVASMMVAHLQLPAFEPNKNLASTLSKNIVDGLLKKHLGFEGLIFTDALDMKGVSSFHKPGVVDKLAFMAGNDVLLFSENVEAAINEIIKGVENGEILASEIDARCMKILKAKKWLGVFDQKSVETEGLHQELHTTEALALNTQLFDKSLTRITNHKSLLPIKAAQKTLSIAWVNDKMQVPGKGTEQLMHHLLIPNSDNEEAGDITSFQQKLKKSIDIECVCFKNNEIEQNLDTLQKRLSKVDVVILSLHGLELKPINDFGITTELLTLVKLISEKSKVIMLLPTSPYALEKFPNLKELDEILVAYQENSFTIDSVIKALKGDIVPEGVLPVSIKGL
ncbi:glycoside hydrolase family 3 N-terminal domain-containing protein [Flammeovirgaceae bacterium SG7u.111]|nr:glycoside hydrolase family 3 N-terminal domain-containing protein [Flammeovirgaceae bacterium SG7u.132]WPO37539.1 glycoside hydrolase family 3 N-terminal domain-containing protein [Flammeovirgaceae bacterium SG7u.111]